MPARKTPLSKRSASDLTARQRNIFDFLVEHISAHGFPPSMREVGQFFGIKSTNGVSDHLRALERKGYISRSAQKGRGIQILKTPDGVDIARVADPEEAGRVAAAQTPAPASAAAEPSGRAQAAAGPTAANSDVVQVPVLGKVAAGKPILAVELADEVVSFPRSLIPNGGATFALRVQGRSMIEAGILPADLVLVQPQPSADNGAIVVAMVDGEATVKRIYHEGDRVRLQPENRDMAPIFVSQDAELELLGKVVGVWRQLS